MADITALRVAQWNGQLNLTLLTKKKVMTNCQNHCTCATVPPFHRASYISSFLGLLFGFVVDSTFLIFRGVRVLASSFFVFSNFNSLIQLGNKL